MPIVTDGVAIVPSIVRTIEIRTAENILGFVETDQVDPAGRWRFRLDGDKVYFERATAANWASDEDWLILDKANELWDFGKKGAARTATLVVAANDSSAKSKAQADYVCDGVNDQVELLASITAAGYYNKSVKWMPGTYYLGALLDIPPLQNYVIDAKGASFMGDQGIRFDSLMDCWIYLGVLTGTLTFQPRNPCPVDVAITAVTTNYISCEDIVPVAGGDAVVFNTTNGNCIFNKIYFSGFNGLSNAADRGLVIQEPGTGFAFYANNIEVGFISGMVVVGALIGAAGSTKIYRDHYRFGTINTATGGRGIDVYSDDEIIEFLDAGGNIAPNEALVWEADASDCILITSAQVATVGFTDNASGANRVWCPTYIQTNKLRSANLLIKEDTTDILRVRDAADTGDRDWRARRLYFSLEVAAMVDGAIVRTKDTDANYVQFQARDTGVGLVEVARLVGAAEPRFQHTLPLNLGADSELTISGGVITVGQAAGAAFYRIDTEGDVASDDLDTINGGAEGDVIVLKPENTARTVVVKHGTGNLVLAGLADFTMDNANDTIVLIYDGTNWLEVSRSSNGA